MIDPGQHEQRACRDADPELFFPMATDIKGTRQVIRAFCANCPVIAECLEYALEHEGTMGHSGRHGIYGGTTPRRRSEIYRERLKAGSPKRGRPEAPINHGTEGGYKTHRRRGEQACDECLSASNLAKNLRAERAGSHPCLDCGENVKTPQSPRCRPCGYLHAKSVRKFPCTVGQLRTTHSIAEGNHRNLAKQTAAALGRNDDRLERFTSLLSAAQDELDRARRDLDEHMESCAECQERVA